MVLEAATHRDRVTENPSRSRFTSVAWAVLLVAAVLWPSRVIGPLDGAPLDRPFEAILLAVVLPILWMLEPRFLQRRLARGLIGAVLVWKLATVALVAQGGWCGELATAYPDSDVYRLERSWDIRTLLTPSPPACSAIVDRRYESLAAFPAWSINVPFDLEWILGRGMSQVPVENPRPPAGAYKMLISGTMRAAAPGTLSFHVARDVALRGWIDGRALPSVRDEAVTLAVGPGEHAIEVALDLSGDRWRFVPEWNGRDLFQALPTRVRPGGRVDRAFGVWSSFVTPTFILVLMVSWIAAAARRLRPNAALAVWVAASGAAVTILALLPSDRTIRWSLIGLVAAIAVPVSTRLRTWRGAVLLLGIPWLCVFVARSIPQVGHFTLFSVGDDWLTFQRFAYRIFMQGFWLQGGEPTFWYQPLYRWTTGTLHLIFGDSSVGDFYWDGFALLVGSLFAFEIANRVAGFRAAVAAAALTLTTVALGPNWYVIGRGLSEISASAWLFLAGISLITARAGRLRYALLAGMFAVLAFYTRLNHLPLIVVLVAFALPENVTAESIFRWRRLRDRFPVRVGVVYLGCVALGVCAFMARTWYYTGEFSLFAGTTRAYNGTGLSLSSTSLLSPTTWRIALGSVLMIATVQDPPRFDARSLLVIGGVCGSLLALLQVPVLRRLPLNLALACVGAVAGGLVARGVAYPGRFSVHVIPLAVTASVLAIVAFTRSQGITVGPEA